MQCIFLKVWCEGRSHTEWERGALMGWVGGDRLSKPAGPAQKESFKKNKPTRQLRLHFDLSNQRQNLRVEVFWGGGCGTVRHRLFFLGVSSRSRGKKTPHLAYRLKRKRSARPEVSSTDNGVNSCKNRQGKGGRVTGKEKDNCKEG